MADFNKHLKVGAAVGGGSVLLIDFGIQISKINQGLQDKFNWEELLKYVLVGTIGGGFCGILPDLLEPATSPFHRQFFHSGTTASICVYSLLKLQDSNLDQDTKNLLTSSGFGYISHLVLDLKTPMGLPFI